MLHVVLEDFSTLASPLFARHGMTAATVDSATASVPATPNLQRLAARGALFRHAYAQAPICNPSRSSFMTGRRPSSTGIFTNEDDFRSTVPASMPTLVDFLRATSPKAAVACASGSKLFHKACDHDAMGMDAEPAPVPDDLPAAVRRAARFVLRPLGPFSADNHRAQMAIGLLVRYARARRKFYVGVGLVETHVTPRPRVQICHEEVVPHDARRWAAHAPAGRWSEHLPPLVTWTNYDFWQVSTPAEQKRAIGMYYACATHVDRTIGALLDTVDALELTNSTAIVVQGDHGFSLGAHGRWSKYNLYEEATRVPLILAVPGKPAAVIDDVVEALDVLPTLLALWSGAAAGRAAAGRAVPSTKRAALEGHSLLPLLAAHGTGGRHRGLRLRRSYARSELHLPCGLGCAMLNQPYDGKPPGFTRTPTVGPVVLYYVRTAAWAYTATFRGKWPQPLRLLDEALFDAQADPGELRNLAYTDAAAPTRWWLLQLVLREWTVTLVGPVNASRWERAEWLRKLTHFRRNWWK